MDISKFIPIANLSEKLVCDKDVDPQLVKKNAISPDLALPIKDIAKFNAHAEASFSVVLFNDVADHVQDGKEDKTMKLWPNVSALYGQGALLGYTLAGKVKAAGNVPLKQFELGIDADQTLELRALKYHPCGTRISDAVVEDLKSFLNIFDPNEVLSMKVNDAVSMQAAGKVEVSATVKWSDVISGTASVISSLLNIAGKVNIKAEVAASLSFKVAIEDDFHVVIIRQASDQYHVALAKVIKRSKELKAKAGITAALQNDEDLKKVADQFFEGIDERVFGAINKLIDTTGLTDQHLALAATAAELLGWKWEVTSIDDFRTEYTKLRDKARKKLIEIATTKVEVGISYEYRRIETTDTLFTASFNKATLKKYAEDIVRLRINNLLDHRNEYTLLSYLRREITEVDSAFGISLSFGNFQLSAGTKRSFMEEKDFEIKAEELVKVSAYNRETTRSFKAGKNTDEYCFRFSGDMPFFVKKESELTAEKFELEFGLSLDITERRSSEKEIRDAIDWAVTWDVIQQDRVEHTYQEIKKIIAVDNNVVKYRLFLSALDTDPNPGSPFGLLIPRMASVSDHELASALAAAVPYADFVGASTDRRNRTELAARRQRYHSFMLSYIQALYKVQETNSPENFSATVRTLLSDQFEKDGLHDLGMFEFLPEQHPRYGVATLGQVLNTNNVGADVVTLRTAFGILHSAIESNVHYAMPFAQFNKQMAHIRFQKDFNLRFVGRLMLDIADDLNIKDQLTRGLSITYQENGKDKVFVAA